MSKSCNLRYHHLRQLEAEFSALGAEGDIMRRAALAREIVGLRAEFGGANLECENLLAKAKVAGHE